MNGPERLAGIAEQLRNGSATQPITVREFLSWFGAQRRGYWIVSNIRESLKKWNLHTEPDFEAEYIDSTIIIASDSPKPTTETPTAAALSATLVASSSVTATLSVSSPSAPYADPTYKISKLEAANRPPVCVKPDATLSEAVTIMLARDFSQLPVMPTERQVKGVISWASIGARLATGGTSNGAVREFMDTANIIEASYSIFQAIPIIVQHQYVLVKSKDEKISGIVTASDLSLQFQQLTEPFLLLNEIENHIRRLIGNKFTPGELDKSRAPAASDRKIERVADMTFGGYIHLINSPEHWAKFLPAIDRVSFCKSLEKVREIRNDVMHFDPDGIEEDDLRELRQFTSFLQRLQGIGIS